jgi:hypothetical protein
MVVDGSFWRQLANIVLLVALTLLCGWLQGVMGWTPVEMELEPPADSAGHDGHGHH